MLWQEVGISCVENKIGCGQFLYGFDNLIVPAKGYRINEAMINTSINERHIHTNERTERRFFRPWNHSLKKHSKHAPNAATFILGATCSVMNPIIKWLPNTLCPVGITKAA